MTSFNSWNKETDLSIPMNLYQNMIRNNKIPTNLKPDIKFFLKKYFNFIWSLKFHSNDSRQMSKMTRNYDHLNNN